MAGFLVYLAVAALGFVLPAPEGVSEAGWRVLFVFIATIVAFITPADARWGRWCW